VIEQQMIKNKSNLNCADLTFKTFKNTSENTDKQSVKIIDKDTLKKQNSSDGYDTNTNTRFFCNARDEVGTLSGTLFPPTTISDKNSPYLQVDTDINKRLNTGNINSAKQKINQNAEAVNDTFTKNRYATALTKHPELLFLFIVIFFICFIVGLVYLYKNFTIFSEKLYDYDDLKKSMITLKDKDIPFQERVKINAEKKALDDYSDFFNVDPFSEINSSTLAIKRGGPVFKVFLFFIQYVLPMLLLTYVAWFLIKFWIILVKAVLMFVYTLIQFNVKYVVCIMLGIMRRFVPFFIKPLIPRPKCPCFYDMIKKWFIRYVFRPIVRECTKYFIKFRLAKIKYYDIPINNVQKRYEKTRTSAYYKKQLYVDKPIDEFYKSIQETINNFSFGKPFLNSVFKSEKARIKKEWNKMYTCEQLDKELNFRVGKLNKTMKKQGKRVGKTQKRMMRYVETPVDKDTSKTIFLVLLVVLVLFFVYVYNNKKPAVIYEWLNQVNYIRAGQLGKQIPQYKNYIGIFLSVLLVWYCYVN
jgi:hypothetical protein